MSLADPCLARLLEIRAAAEVLTLDSDFRIYRRHGNKVIPLGMRADGRIGVAGTTPGASRPGNFLKGVCWS